LNHAMKSAVHSKLSHSTALHTAVECDDNTGSGDSGHHLGRIELLHERHHSIGGCVLGVCEFRMRMQLVAKRRQHLRHSSMCTSALARHEHQLFGVLRPENGGSSALRPIRCTWDHTPINGYRLLCVTTDHCTRSFTGDAVRTDTKNRVRVGA